MPLYIVLLSPVKRSYIQEIRREICTVWKQLNTSVDIDVTGQQGIDFFLIIIDYRWFKVKHLDGIVTDRQLYTSQGVDGPELNYSFKVELG